MSDSLDPTEKLLQEQFHVGVDALFKLLEAKQKLHAIADVLKRLEGVRENIRQLTASLKPKLTVEVMLVEFQLIEGYITSIDLLCASMEKILADEAK